MEGTHAWQDRCRRGRDQRVAGRRLASAHRSRRDRAVHVRVTGRSSWEEGGDIVWKGEYDGKQYEDKGKILQVDPPRRLALTHFSPTSGKHDHPDNYHTLVYELEEADDGTRIRLSQDNNASTEEAESSRANWEMMLSGLKKVVEHRQPAA